MHKRFVIVHKKLIFSTIYQDCKRDIRVSNLWDNAKKRHILSIVCLLFLCYNELEVNLIPFLQFAQGRIGFTDAEKGSRILVSKIK